MGTSNWQHIPFCVEVLMKIEPKCVLDVGVGFGRWGIIVREFCDVWFGRVLPEQWSVYIEGIEAFAPNISDYHSYFYNKIYVGDALEIIPRMDGFWDVVIFGDVIEHFKREDAEKLLYWSIEHSHYVIVNVPLGEEWSQDEMYGNPYERHQSVWQEEDFSEFHLVRKATFYDFLGRKHGSFILSRDDARDVSRRLFSLGTGREMHESFDQIIATTEHDNEVMQGIVMQVRSMAGELEAIKRSRSYRTIIRLRHSLPGKAAARAFSFVERRIEPGKHLSTARRLVSQFVRYAAPKAGAYLSEQVYPIPSGFVRLRLIGRNPQSQGAEAWILAVQNSHGFLASDQVQLHGRWTVREGAGLKGRPALVASEHGWADIPAGNGAWLVLLRHPWSGIVELQTRNGRRRFDLYAPQAHDIIVDLATLELKHSLPPVRLAPLPDTARSWLEAVDRRQGVVTVVNPEWRGVYSSAKNLFDNILELSDSLNEATGLQYARLLAEMGCQIVVIQGFPLTYYHLITALRRIAPKVRIAVIWHGTFLQVTEDYAWRSFLQVERLCLEGVIWKWGFVKARMAEIMANRGIRTGFIQNMVREVPDRPSVPLSAGPHFGIWQLYAGSWRKNPFASIAAVSVFPCATLHMSGVDDRIREFVQFMNISANLHDQSINQGLMRHYLAQMHLNLYVTLSECAPMLPLESLSVGAPCLIGPTTYYFEDHEYLRSRLVVPQPDDAGLIAEYMRRALEERDQIIAEYIKYAPSHNRRARALLAEFLELDAANSPSSDP
ncbi:MAG: hypothetical protein RMJ48_11560 [Roseiflexaceae bacterium]|nr:hypothetical protein [Roseiflexaceae bacterium]